MSARVERRDPNAVQRVYSRMGSFGNREVAVGFPQGTAQAYPESGDSVAEVAAQHVYGVGVPQRDFMAQAQDGILERTRPLLRVAAREAGRGNASQAEKMLEAAGMAGAAEIKKAIVEGEYLPLAESTIEKRYEKGHRSAKPLIETGHMLRSATHVVREAGGG